MQHKEEEQVFQQLISGTQGELQQRHNSNHIPKIRFPGEFVFISNTGATKMDAGRSGISKLRIRVDELIYSG